MVTPDTIKARANEIGFDLCGIAPAAALPELTRLREWLDSGYAGEMIYLHKSAETRADIRNFLPSARSVIVTGTVYYTDGGAHQGGTAFDSGESGVAQARKVPPLPEGARHGVHNGGTDIRGDRCRGGASLDYARDRSAPPSGAIARYAWGEDYHVVLAERLEELVAWMRAQHADPFEASIFVDKHHVQERVFARHAGLGWIGKNTCLINPELGSWLFLAGAAVSLDLTPDAPGSDRCGACTLCIDACPTGALIDPYVMDATRCISYLTIELGGPIPESQRASTGHHVFGCDICQDVCPWNLAPTATLDPVWQPRAGRATVHAADLWQRTDDELHALVRGSAMTRTTASRLRRNVAVAIGNSGDARSAAALDRPGHGVRRAAPSAETPLVKEHVAWAKEELRVRR